MPTVNTVAFRATQATPEEKICCSFR
jgi:hypothetical protein